MYGFFCPWLLIIFVHGCINSQKAKTELDGKVLEGATRPLRVRFSSHPAALKIKNLAPTITNEFLEKAFSMVGAGKLGRLGSGGKRLRKEIVTEGRTEGLTKKWLVGSCFFGLLIW